MVQQIFRFLSHLIRAQSRYGVHSPFVYEFVTQVLPHSKSDWGGRIDAVRKEMSRSKRTLEILDLGAGYGGQHESKIRKTIAQVVRSSARKRRSGELLYRICQWHQPEVGLELGTNLGFSTAYQVAGQLAGWEASRIHNDSNQVKSRFHSIEGAPALYQEATDLLSELKLEAELISGDFTEQLKKFTDQNIQLDYVLMDGNHQYGPTMDYFDHLMDLMNPNGLIIVDDINWSPGMRKAWQEIRQREDVQVTIDLFFMGLCFVNRSQAKEDFRFRLWP